MLPCGFILSFRSTVILSAVFAPIPLIFFRRAWSPEAIADSSSGADRELNMTRAVLAPTPETPISDLNTSARVRN